MSQANVLLHEPALATRANHLLRRLPALDLERIRPYLEPVELASGQTLYRADEPIEHAYFPLSGVGSLVARTSDGRGVEVSMTGRDGVIGLGLFLGASADPFEAIQQISGTALRMNASVFCAEMESRGPLYSAMQRYAVAFMASVAQTVACNRLHNLEERAARWLLLTHDRLDADEFGLTHEFFATMLGVHRPSVTLAAGRLQSAGLISYHRGVFTIIDRERLEDASCECYAVIRDAYARILGEPLN